jgi:hypothetical protein
MNSLSADAKIKVYIHKNEYLIEDPTHNDADATPKMFASALLFLKVIIRESHIDTHATVASIRTKLSNLDEYIVTINSDITKFNQYVYLLVNALKARNKTTDDLLINLFKGYLCASDKTFVAYIQRKQEKYEDEEQEEELTPPVLMNAANTKYKILKEKGVWNAPSEEEEKILALEAKVSKLEKKKSPRAPKNDDRSNERERRKTVSKKPKELLTPPMEAELRKPIQWNNRTWYWCHADTGGKCPGVWRCHKPEKCEGKAHKFSGTKRGGDGDGKQKKALKLTKAMQALVGEE